MPKKVRILLTGGGSGGHIIPNLVVAAAIKKRQPDAEILYVASSHSLDREWLSEASFPVRFIFADKLRRYFSWRNFLAPFFIVLGFFQALVILLQWRPQVVFSKGGYVTLPVVVAAYLLRIKIILHESDSRMGLTNRFGARLASRVCVAFDTLVKNEKYTLTGNPIRQVMLTGDKKIAQQLTGFTSALPVLLVWGGSQGAKQVNELLLADFERFTTHFQIVHLTGKDKINLKNTARYQAFEYLEEEKLKHIYALTDLVVGRAGANSLFELALLQKPNVIIPLSNADQLGNARYFEGHHAALVYKPSDKLFELTWSLWQDESLRSSMQVALKKLSTPAAAQDIADLILA